jgi:hypothetical protein
VSSGVAVDRAGALAAGFDLKAIEDRLARSIKAPIQWSASDFGETNATGFSPTSSLTGSIEVKSGYRHVRPDPAYCDGNVCRRGDVEVTRSTCPERLELPIQLDLATEDQALQATADGTATQWKGASAEEIKDTVVVKAAVDLRNVNGTLELKTDAPAGTYQGILVIALDLQASSVTGSVEPTLVFDGTVETPVRGDVGADGDSNTSSDTGAPRK